MTPDIIARAKIRTVATKIAHAETSIGTPAAGHSGQPPIARLMPIGMMSRIKRRTTPMINSFLVTAPR